MDIKKVILKLKLKLDSSDNNSNESEEIKKSQTSS